MVKRKESFNNFDRRIFQYHLLILIEQIQGGISFDIVKILLAIIIP